MVQQRSSTKACEIREIQPPNKKFHKEFVASQRTPTAWAKMAGVEIENDAGMEERGIFDAIVYAESH